MDMAEDHQIKGFVEIGGISTVNREPSTVERLLILEVGPFELGTQGVGNRSRHPSEGFEKRPAFEDRFPGRMSSQPMPVRDPNLDPLDDRLESIRQERRAKSLLIKGAEPGVVVAGQDRDRPPSRAKLRKRPKPLATHRISLSLSSREPEVAEVADDRQRVRRCQARDHSREPSTSIGMVEPEVNVAEKIVGHGIKPLPRGTASGRWWLRIVDADPA